MSEAPFVVQEYPTTCGSGWCAIHPETGIVIATTTQDAAHYAANALNAAYRLGAQERWCETVPIEYADAAVELMAAADDAACGFDVLADEHLCRAQEAIRLLRGENHSGGVDVREALAAMEGTASRCSAHFSLLEVAYSRLIRRLLGQINPNTSVSPKQTLANLQGIADEIAELIDALEESIR